MVQAEPPLSLLRVPTPWEGRWWGYAQRHGIQVTMDAEVAGLTPEGPKPYWRGHVTHIAYEWAAL